MKQKKPRHKRNKKELAPLYRYLNYSEKQRKQIYESFTERLSENMQFTGDIIAGQPLISLVGNHCIKIINYQSILEYSTTKIRISTKQCQICICGDKLCIQYFVRDEIKIVGRIDAISYQK